MASDMDGIDDDQEETHQITWKHIGQEDKAILIFKQKNYCRGQHEPRSKSQI